VGYRDGTVFDLRTMRGGGEGKRRRRLEKGGFRKLVPIGSGGKQLLAGVSYLKTEESGGKRLGKQPKKRNVKKNSASARLKLREKVDQFSTHRQSGY